MNKYLPNSIQNIKDLLEKNYIYVDKTKTIYELIKKPKGIYFLSRPRRFGKSLLVSTLEEIFKGNKELFKDQWIYNSDYSWQPHPVIKLDMSSASALDTEELEYKLHRIVDINAQKFGLNLSDKYPDSKLDTLIRTLEDNVVILIDEYDKPILDTINKPEIAQKFREILKNFYTVLKVREPKLRFVFLTGVSKFSQVSIFSGLNNLQDITESEITASLLGITQEELEKYFSPYIDELATKEDTSRKETLNKIKHWYNGYRFTDKDVRVYNPYSTISLFVEQKFKNFWFKSGTPTFLLNTLKERNFDLLRTLEEGHEEEYIFDTHDVNSVSTSALLLQTGYLTIKDYKDELYRLGYPNYEVEESLTKNLLAWYSNLDDQEARSNLRRLKKHLQNGEIDLFIEVMKRYYASVSWKVTEKRESNLKMIFYVVLDILGFKVDGEEYTNRGIIDAVLEIDDKVYVIEFKMSGDPKECIEQIKDKGYYEKYTDKKIYLLGIVFDKKVVNIGEYVLEAVKK